MDFLERDLGTLGPDDIVEVTLDHAANVQLLDESNYQEYRARRSFRYYGGYVRTSPFRIPVPHVGHWHLVIDLGGGPGIVRAAVRVLSSLPT